MGAGAGAGVAGGGAVIARGTRSFFLYTVRQPGRAGSGGPSIAGGASGGGGAGSSMGICGNRTFRKAASRDQGTTHTGGGPQLGE